MELYTARLRLRYWEDDDAESLYEIAKDERVGPICGWAVHRSAEESLEVIKNILKKENTFAIVLKESNKLIGLVSLDVGRKGIHHYEKYGGEIGFYIGYPYWGKGYVTEAVKEVIRYGFEALDLKELWCGYFIGNERSARVQEKCGFKYHHTEDNIFNESLCEYKTERFTYLSKERWEDIKKSSAIHK